MLQQVGGQLDTDRELFLAVTGIKGRPNVSKTQRSSHSTSDIVEQVEGQIHTGREVFVA